SDRQSRPRRVYFDSVGTADHAGGLSHHLLEVVGDRLPTSARAIPLEHGELGVVMRAKLPTTEHLTQRINSREAPRQQTLELILRAGDEVVAFAAKGVEVE